MARQDDFENVLRALLMLHLPATFALQIIRGEQPQREGRTNGIYYHRIGTTMRGWQARSYELQSPDQLNQTERQITEYLYQFTAVADSDPHDFIEVVRMTIASLAFVEVARIYTIGVQRPSNILSPTFVNERGQYEQSPNFTVAFTLQQSATKLTASTDAATIETL